MSEQLSREDLLRKVLFIPCNNKKALHSWIKLFLGLDIPDGLVDPTSTGSPMDSIWEVYERALKNDDPNFSRVLCYASRDSFKTLGAAILEVLSVVHLKRSVAHLAAIEAQAQKAQSYVKDFLSRPYLRDYLVGDNKRKTEYLRYENVETRECITEKQWEVLSDGDKARYNKVYNYITILVCTMQSTNSEHVPFMVVDEVDVVSNPRAYEEAKLIPAPMNGQMPITLLTSTRKFSIGLVQKEIDNANDEKGNVKLHVKHWNIIDVTAACPQERHRPDLPRLTLYRSDKTLRTLPEEDYDALDKKEQEKYVKQENCYNGCYTRCRMFAMCQGRLATQQTSKSPLLKPVEHTQNQFGAVSVETAQAQLLCWKPSTEGLIYPRFSKDLHMMTPPEMAQKITGDTYPANFSKGDLIRLLKARGTKFVAGMDFGYTHSFAVVVMAVDGARGFIVDCISVKGLELPQRIELCEQRLKSYDASIFPDTAYPADIKTFKRYGFRMREWHKTPGSVKAGIEIVRMKFMPSIGEPQLYLLRGDEGCELLAKRITQYHWIIDQAGEPTDEPAEKDDDECDALRYCVMNTFAPKGKITIDQQQPQPLPLIAAQQGQYTTQNAIQKAIQEQLGAQIDSLVDGSGPVRGKKGGFFFDM